MKKIVLYIITIFLLLIPFSVKAQGIELTELTPVSKSDEDILIEPDPGENFKITFIRENQEVVYKAVLKNTENENITVKNIEIPNRNELLAYTYNGIKKGDMLQAGETREITISIRTLDKNNNINVDENFLFIVNYDRLETNNILVNPLTGNSIKIVLILGVLSLLFFRYLNIRDKKTYLSLLLIGLLIVPFNVFASNNQLIIRGHILYKATHSISINPNGGTYNNSTDIYTKDVLDGEEISLNAELEYYEIDYWQLNGGEHYTNNKIKVTKDMNLVAIWKPIYYNVTINPNGGLYNSNSEVQQESVRAGTYYELGTISRDRYELDKWEINPSSKQIENNKVFVDSNISLKALWNELYATLTVDPNGGSYNGYTDNYVDSFLLEDNITTTLQVPVYPGKRFIHWELSDGTEYNENTILMDKDITLKAIYEDIIYNVVIDPNGGLLNESAEVISQGVLYETTFDISNIKRNDYLFRGWEDLNTGTILDTNQIVVHDDVNIKAKWVEIKCRIGETYYDSIMSAHEEAQAGDTITLLKDTEEVVTNSKEVTLDLNGYTVTGSITNESTGNLTLINGEINNPNGIAVTNNGELTLGINDLDDEGVSNVINDDIRIIEQQ